MHHHQDTEEVHRGRHDRRQDDVPERDFQELHHQERGRTQNRRRDLSAGRRRRFDGTGEVRLVADPLHGRDGERTGHYRVGDRGARDHAHQGRRQHADLGRAAGVTTGDAMREVDEQLAQADADGDHAEQHEMEHIGGDDQHRAAVDALALEIEMIHQRRPAGARIHQRIVEVDAEQRIHDEHVGDDRQRDARRASGRLDHDQHHGGTHGDVHQGRVADAEVERLEHTLEAVVRDRHIERADRDQHEQEPVVCRHAAAPAGVAFLHRGGGECGPARDHRFQRDDQGRDTGCRDQATAVVREPPGDATDTAGEIIDGGGKQNDHHRHALTRLDDLGQHHHGEPGADRRRRAVGAPEVVADEAVQGAEGMDDEQHERGDQDVIGDLLAGGPPAHRAGPAKMDDKDEIDEEGGGCELA